MKTSRTVHEYVVLIAEQLQAHLMVLEQEFPQDAEGCPIYDGSDLSDALKAMATAVSSLSSLAYKISGRGGREEPTIRLI